ncbi:uncharacterized protein SCODWIG_02838 [Saccharomycodes ludwigii]|uniref:Uncharacterized protein n=1 Tax=Saccharomycodes ludwigii TaxID=36035 RepID=A0A376B8U1_9ASCO|nr:hypothetical protein SCDLUD_002730 [Saccharomycodes ludwigii]KAH3901242.1 hypothetical protein SCDLUD_002730 [Saccharomycodes ludwigii]SSD61077.1 uncharacterized protein SCODWIG_02838 [Saccharomycodes ludwigii]
MNIFVFLIVFLIILFIVLVLPTLSGLGSFHIDKNALNDIKNRKSHRTGSLNEKSNEFGQEQETINNKSIFRSKPLKFKIKQEEPPQNQEQSCNGNSNSFDNRYTANSRTGLKNRVTAKYNSDPNAFDFEVDDLINEDRDLEKIEQEKRFAQIKGKENEILEELA